MRSRSASATLQALLDELAIERLVGLATDDAGADQRMRIDVGVAEETARCAPAAHERARLRSARQRRAGDVDFVAEHPGVPGRMRRSSPRFRRSTGSDGDGRSGLCGVCNHGGLECRQRRSIPNQRGGLSATISRRIARYSVEERFQHTSATMKSRHVNDDGTPRYTNRLSAETIALSAAARPQPGGLVCLGKRGVRAGAQRKTSRSS